MQFYNTLTQRSEPLHTADNVVRMYVCGITPYDTAHLGHARIAVVYDTLRRYLQSQGLDVRYVQNITDIDDPLFERARRDGVPWDQLARQQIDLYLDSLRQLDVRMPDHLVRVTDVVDNMLPLIEQLVELGHAYVSNNAVYYDAASFPRFGEIAHTTASDLLQLANEMGNDPGDPNKRDPLDFVLWQPSNQDEPAWQSPWGPGRPGWHIECSTIATMYLGSHIDIHGGGTDLIFPHHACEIAQAEPVTGTPFVRHWMHTGLVELNGTKMSKSLGNMVFVGDLLQTCAPQAIRLALLSYPYRAPFEYQDAIVDLASQRLALVQAALDRPAAEPSAEAQAAHSRFFNALANDFDTPAAIDVLCTLAEHTLAQPAEQRATPAADHPLRSMCRVLGIAA